MSAAEIERVEDIANDIVLQNSPVTTRLMAVDDAIASGARALFGEKYGDEVRVVAMGETAAATPWAGRSSCAAARMCGAPATSGSSRSSAKRRRGRRAPHRGADRRGRAQGRATTSASCAKTAAAELKVPLEDAAGRARSSRCDERRRLERELSEAKKKLAMGGGGSGGWRRRRAHGRRHQAAGARGRGHRHQGPARASPTRARSSSAPASSRSSAPARTARPASWSASPPISSARFSAVDLVRKASEVLGGKGGGGRPDMAQAGGPDGSKADAALAAIEAALGG